jgi:GT2 family glycosyltransferase
MKNIEGEIIVVDNNSSDGSFEFFHNRFSEVKFIWNKNNPGFAKANNQALKIAKGEYILFLNPDTIIAEDCFKKCIFFIKTKNNNCAVGIKMIDGQGRFLKESKRSFPSPFPSLYKLFGFSKLFPHSKMFSKYNLGYLDENKNHEVDVLAGAFMMIPKKILDITGGFDEDFFMYGEDIDLSYRIQKAGFKNYYFAESAMIHFKGESTKKGSLNYVVIFYQAMSIFVKKHYGRRGGLFGFFIHVAIVIRASISAFSRLLKFKPKRPTDMTKDDAACSIVIVGNQENFENAKQIAEVSGRKNILYYHIENNTTRLPAEIELGQAKEIIFCEGTLSFKKIIEIMQQIDGKINIQIYSSGSSAIIGSK